MLIDEQLRKCAVLLLVDVPDPEQPDRPKRIPAGTGFLVSMPLTSTRMQCYIVTALHVVVAARPFGNMWMRFNITPEHVPEGNPGYEDVPIDLAAWYEHDTTDVALARLPGFASGVADVRVLAHDWIATNDVVDQRDLGIGDDLIFVGLFSPLPGSDRFEPVVRFGNISRMPVEKVTVEIYPDTPVRVDAYLVEARSWSGHSGSPAFVIFPQDRVPGVLTLTIGGEHPVLLGLVSGHFPVRTTPIRDSLDSVQESANSGIAAVIPAQAIADLLNDGELVAQRREATKDLESDSPVVADTAITTGAPLARDFSQRALDVVREATEDHEGSAD